MKHFQKILVNHTGVKIAMTFALLAGLVACGDDDPATTTDPTFSVNAVGSQEVPGNNSTATATGTLTLDESTGALSGTITTNGITATAAHIHDGFAGSNGSVVVPLTVTASSITVPANTMLSAAQIDNMKGGQYYVNVHSAAFPSGELRDQLLGSGVSLLVASLDGGQEVPAVTSAASGTGYLTVNTNTNTVTASLAVSGADDATAAHIHTGAVGSNGGVLVGLTSSSVGNWGVGNAAIDAADIATILAGGNYFNVHTPSNPSGEIRGQIVAP